MVEAKKHAYRVRKPARYSRHPTLGYSARCRVWLEKDGELYVGGGRVALLEAIDRYGSISAAARSMKLGYRNAWLWVQAMNRLAPSPLVLKGTGGAKGGYAVLTNEGHKVVQEFYQINDRCKEVLKERE
jgi:molybdate transport system regulatory protein